jgi:hypothetical protein
MVLLFPSIQTGAKIQLTDKDLNLKWIEARGFIWYGDGVRFRESVPNRHHQQLDDDIKIIKAERPLFKCQQESEHVRK